MFKPLKDSTVVSQDCYEFRPKTFPDFLDELEHITNEIPDVCFFRGQRRSDRLLDSTFARQMKIQRKLNEIERYPDHLRQNTEFQYELAEDLLNYLYKVPILVPFLQNQSSGVRIGANTIDLLYHYHVHVQQEPDDPNLIALTSFGTNFLDFTYDRKVGIFFANRRRCEADEGALFIVRQVSLGKAFHGGDTPFQKIITLLQTEVTKPQRKGYSGLPRMPWPEAQILPEKVKRQNAIYIAQMDFRHDLELSWKKLHQETQNQVFVKLILPAGTCEEVQKYLVAQKMTEEYLFPPKLFDSSL